MLGRCRGGSGEGPGYPPRGPRNRPSGGVRGWSRGGRGRGREGGARGGLGRGCGGKVAQIQCGSPIPGRGRGWGLGLEGGGGPRYSGSKDLPKQVFSEPKLSRRCPPRSSGVGELRCGAAATYHKKYHDCYAGNRHLEHVQNLPPSFPRDRFLSPGTAARPLRRGYDITW